MKLNRKNLLRIMLFTLVSVIVVWLITLWSVSDIYDCAGKNLTAEQCTALDSADTKINIASAYQIVAGLVFILSGILYLRLRLQKKP